MRGNCSPLLLATIFFAAGFLSCSIDYEKGMLDEEISDTIPNAVLVNFAEVSVRKGSTAYRVEGERAESFNRKKLTVFTNLYFTEYDSDESLATEGVAEKAVFHSENEDIVFEGYFSLNAAQQGFYIEGESAGWKGKEKTLSAADDTIVTIGRDDGSFIKGYGFSSSAADRSFSFEAGAEGVFVTEEENEETPEEGDNGLQ